MRYHFFSFFLLILSAITHTGYSGCAFANNISDPDTLPANRIVYNGRIWRDNYIGIKGDQFLFSRSFLPGTVLMEGVVYKGLMIRYDIYKDEIQIITDKNIILQLNREMIQEFTIHYNSREYAFAKMSESDPELSGFIDLRYKGKSGLFVKHKKEISEMGPGKNYRNFVQKDIVYSMMNGSLYKLKNKRDIKRLFGTESNIMTIFVRSGRLGVSIKEPDSLIPMFKHYDSVVR